MTAPTTYTPEKIREQFGLEFNEDHAKLSGSAYSRETGGDGFTNGGAIFSKGGQYIGSIDPDGDDEYYQGFQSLGDAANPIKMKAEGKEFSNFSSLSDVAGAARWLIDDEKKEPEGPTPPRKPIAESPGLAKARARVAQHEEDIFTGKYSRDLYDQWYNPAGANNFASRYKEKLGKELKNGLYQDPQDKKRWDYETSVYKKALADPNWGNMNNPDESKGTNNVAVTNRDDKQNPYTDPYGGLYS